MRRSGTATSLAVGFFVLVAFGLGVAAFFLADTQEEQRDALRKRYADRTVIARNLLDSLFLVATRGQTGGLTDELGGARVSRAAIDAHVRQAGARWAVVLDANGGVVARSGGAPADAGRLAAAPYARSAASSLGFGLGDVHDGLIETAVGFPVRTGGERRVLVTSAPAESIEVILSGIITALPGVRTSRSYILDGEGQRIVAYAPDSTLPPQTPTLINALRASTSGNLTTTAGEDRFFASQPVAGSRWRLVLTVSEEALYEPVGGWSRWAPWGILALLVLAMVGIALLLRRVLHATSALRTANAELARSNADLEQFAYVASHDLSEPLRTVAGFSTLLQKRYQGRLDANADLYIQHMATGVERMQALIDDLLTYSRLGRAPLRLETVDLDDVLGEVLQSIDVRLRERGARVTSEELPTVQAEPGQLRQVLQNLIANAVKFTAPGVTPEVRIAAARERGAWRIEVRDNGIGVPPEQREAIFKMFGRLHRDGDYKGTGIGLALVRRIVERHGGHVWVEDPPEGTGSAFVFTLPDRAPVPDAARPEKIPA